ncbi:MAG: SH3 domain-containing protein [Chloroflexota bacterium]|nr:SH3 domain-containing protein [Chloroflexota bacterium]
MNKRMFRLGVLLTITLMVLASSLARGQEGEPPVPSAPPLVVFIEESQQLDMASVTTEGPTGLTQLAAIFRSFGAQTEFARLRDPLPENISVIVLVRPRRPIPVDFLGRIWARMQQGANLLLAVDPSGHIRGGTESPTGGMARLLNADYGTQLFAGLLIQPWFTQESVSALETSFLPMLPYPLANRVNQPIVAYDLPVVTWGARPVGAELFGIDSAAYPLIYANVPFAEANARAYAPITTRDPLEVNYNQDATGRLTIGVIGENTRTNTRVALLGDGEMLMNGYGLALTQTAQGVQPLHLGNTLLAERIAAWLLDVPPENDPPLPSGLTWIAVDGERADWDDSLDAPTLQGESPVNVLSLRIQTARALRNDSFMYVLIESAATPNPDAQLEFQLDSRGSGVADTLVVANVDGVFLQREDGTREPISDAAYRIGNVIEARLPLRVTGFSGAIPGICLTTATPLAFPTPPDCLTSATPIRFREERDPADVRVSESTGLMVMTRTNDIANVREGPDTTFNVVVGLRNGRLLRATGRNTIGDWVQVETARYIGWISNFVFTANGDIMTLPVVEGT